MSRTTKFDVVNQLHDLDACIDATIWVHKKCIEYNKSPCTIAKEMNIFIDYLQDYTRIKNYKLCTIIRNFLETKKLQRKMKQI